MLSIIFENRIDLLFTLRHIICLHDFKISPVQFCPAPVYPGLQVQLYEPRVLLQSACTPQTRVDSAHSSMSIEKFNSCLHKHV